MQPSFDFLIIETYQDLAILVAGLAASLFIARVIWVRLRRPRAAKTASKPAKASRARVAGGDRLATGPEFERLASMITEATDRAEHLSETQSAAALKLDSAEMAVNRLVAEIEAVMTVPGPAHLASTAKPVAQAPATQRSNLAA